MKDVRLGSEIDDNITELSTLIDHTAQTNADPQHKAAVPAVQASETTKAAMAGSADAEVSLLLTYRCLCVCLQRDCLCVCLQRDCLCVCLQRDCLCVCLQKDCLCSSTKRLILYIRIWDASSRLHCMTNGKAHGFHCTEISHSNSSRLSLIVYTDNCSKVTSMSTYNW